MDDWSSLMVITKINLLQNSEAKNYFETRERIFLKSIKEKLENSKEDLNLLDKTKFEEIYKKYSKFL